MKEYLYVSFYVGLGVLMEWVARGAGLDGFFGETGAASWHPGES